MKELCLNPVKTELLRAFKSGGCFPPPLLKFDLDNPGQ